MLFSYDRLREGALELDLRSWFAICQMYDLRQITYPLSASVSSSEKCEQHYYLPHSVIAVSQPQHHRHVGLDHSVGGIVEGVLCFLECSAVYLAVHLLDASGALQL